MNSNELKQRILFVDDDAHILEGLRRNLHVMQNEWDMEFAQSADEALHIMKQQPIDVIIADVKMPGMNGIELLKEVKKQSPNTIRFIFTGFSDQEIILQAIGPTDQFITKPCDAYMLKSIINEACESQKVVGIKTIDRLTSKMESLPTLPKSYAKIKELLESDKSSFQEIADVISKDVAITAKVLQLVNSAFFGLKHSIRNVQHALTYLGIETIKGIIITADIFSKFSKEEVGRFEINELYNHSYLVGLIGSKIVKTIFRDRRIADEVTMAGMLHDIGKLIFIKNFPQQYYEIYYRHKKEKVPLDKLEKEQFEGVSHAVIGGYLMKLWGFPVNIIEAITFHHNPLFSIDTSFNILTLVYVANILEHEQSEEPERMSMESINKQYLTKVDLLKFLPEWDTITKAIKGTHLREDSDEYR